MSQDILVVDDESGIRTVLSISLMDMGHRVRLAETADDAILQVKQQRPSIVLTDIKMPGMDGIELLKAIKAHDPDIEVIMMTGHGDMELAIQSLKLEATDFITKPIGNDALEIAVRRASDRISMRRQLRQYTERLEQLVEEKTRRLIDAERLAAVGEAISGLSHTIKNIAGGLRGGMFVLERGIDQQDRECLTQGWTMVKGNAEKLYKLAMDLLHYGKAAELHMQWCDPNAPAEQALQVVQDQAAAGGVRIRFDRQPTDHLFWMDPDAMATALSNLLYNAIDACMDERLERTGEVRLSVRVDDNREIVYQIEDTGVGMDAETMERVFRWFYTTKGSRGTGIGLMTAKRTIEKRGGKLYLESTFGQGTRIDIRLPKKGSIEG